MTRERDEIVRTIVRETLAERFTDDEFVFDPIRVVPLVDEFGDGDGKEYLRIIIVFRRRPEKARSRLDLGLNKTP